MHGKRNICIDLKMSKIFLSLNSQTQCESNQKGKLTQSTILTDLVWKQIKMWLGWEVGAETKGEKALQVHSTFWIMAQLPVLWQRRPEGPKLPKRHNWTFYSMETGVRVGLTSLFCTFQRGIDKTPSGRTGWWYTQSLFLPCHSWWPCNCHSFVSFWLHKLFRIPP